MQESHAAHEEARRARLGAGFILSGLSGGHAVFHWFIQSFLVLLPEVKAAFGLGEVQVGAIVTTREVVSGLVTLPGGVVSDMLRRHWGLVLALCMAGFGLGWMVIGLSPVYPVLLAGMALVSISASMWHLPAMASLSHHFAHRRGSALSFHGVGGSVGDVVGPALTGILLGVLSWRGIISIYAVVPLWLAFLVFWAFRDIGRRAEAEEVVGLGERVLRTRRLLRDLRLWGVTLVAGLRGMAFVTFVTFLPLYLDQELGMSQQARGFHVALLVLVGVVATPVMGYLSDRLGRKLVLVPGMVFLCIVTLLLLPFGQGVSLALLLAALGLFLYSDQPILTAAALDIVGHDVATTTLGVLSFSRFLLSALSPLIGGALYQVIGIEATFLYVAALFAVSVALLVVVPIPWGAGRRRAPAGHHH